MHSYELIAQEPVTNAAYSHYGVDFLAAVQKGHIIGVQFHPEKSQGPGLKLLKISARISFNVTLPRYTDSAFRRLLRA